jgi:hypothetical protein
MVGAVVVGGVESVEKCEKSLICLNFLSTKLQPFPVFSCFDSFEPFYKRFLHIFKTTFQQLLNMDLLKKISLLFPSSDFLYPRCTY